MAMRARRAGGRFLWLAWLKKAAPHDFWQVETGTSAGYRTSHPHCGGFIAGSKRGHGARSPCPSGTSVSSQPSCSGTHGV